MSCTNPKDRCNYVSCTEFIRWKAKIETPDVYYIASNSGTEKFIVDRVSVNVNDKDGYVNQFVYEACPYGDTINITLNYIRPYNSSSHYKPQKK
jgi:hypothetical protein